MAKRRPNPTPAPPASAGAQGGLLGAWNRWWFTPEPGHRLAAFRILFGSYLLIYFGSFAPKVTILFSTAGVYTPWLVSDIALPPFGAVALYTLMLAVIGAFIAGWRTRWITPVLLVLYVYFWLLNLAVKNTAYDRLNLLILATLCFGELDAVWAVAPSRRRAPGEPPLVLPWAGRLVALQICFLYFGAGLWKFCAPAWQTGEMMKWTLLGPWGTPAAFWFQKLGPPAWFWDLQTQAIVLFELVSGITFHVRRLRLATAVIGTFFHLSIGIFLNIPEFMNCVAAYVLFWEPAEIQRAVERLTDRLRDRRVR
jgi:hypothetical protein